MPCTLALLRLCFCCTRLHALVCACLRGSTLPRARRRPRVWECLRAVCAEVRVAMRELTEPLPAPRAGRAPSPRLAAWLSGVGAAGGAATAAVAELEELGGAMQHAVADDDVEAAEDARGGGGSGGDVHLAPAMRAAVKVAALLGAARLCADAWSRRAVRVTATQQVCTHAEHANACLCACVCMYPS
jgi:hypothetical protein